VLVFLRRRVVRVDRRQTRPSLLIPILTPVGQDIVGTPDMPGCTTQPTSTLVPDSNRISAMVPDHGQGIMAYSVTAHSDDSSLCVHTGISTLSVHDVCCDKENFTPRAETPRNRNSSPHAVHTDTSSDTSVVTALTEHDRMYSGTAFYAFDNDGVNVLRDRTFLPIPTYDNASALTRAATASQGAAPPISPCPTASSEPISPTRTPPPNRQPI